MDGVVSGISGMNSSIEAVEVSGEGGTSLTSSSCVGSEGVFVKFSVILDGVSLALSSIICIFSFDSSSIHDIISHDLI